MAVLPHLDVLLACLLPALDDCRRRLLTPSPVRSWYKGAGKGPLEVVSALDEVIEQRLISQLSHHFPSIPIVAEESQHDWSALSGEACFVIDPIDGTREFLAGRDGYSISVALLEYGEPVVGILDFPARRERFWGSRGNGAYRDGLPICVAPPPRAESPQLVAVSPRQSEALCFTSLQAALPGVHLIPCGAMASKLAGVACGNFHAAAFLATPGSRAPIWDFAAAALILAEAGGDFVDLDGRPLLHPLPQVLLNGWFASNGTPPAALLSTLKACSTSPCVPAAQSK